jgi:hypothetical protein
LIDPLRFLEQYEVAAQILAAGLVSIVRI